MESAAARGGSSRTEWRPVSEHSSFQNNINEEGTGSVDLLLSDETVKKRIEEIARQREELQNAEIGMRAQVIAGAEILEMQARFQSQIQEQGNAASELKEQIQEREHHIHELEMKLEEKERELCAVKLDNEAAWAKDDLLREQNIELATFRRDRTNLEAERAQHLKQMHELQEHAQDKESRILSLEEQHRVAQETILFKDEQLREAQTWIARVQEMDALQSTTWQAQLQERTEQFNQCWIGIQRQFAEVERHRLHTIQQLQLELAEARERNVVYKDGTKVAHQNSTDSSSFIQNNGNQVNANDAGALNGNLGFIPNGNPDGRPYASSSSASSETEHGASIGVVPSPVVGMGAFIPPIQMTALHPFVMHPQGVPQSVSSSSPHISESHVGHFQPMTTVSPHQNLQQQQMMADVSQNHNQSNSQPSKTEQNLATSDAQCTYELLAERQVIHQDHPDASVEQQQRAGAIINGSSNEDKALESNGKQYKMSEEPQQTLSTNATLHSTRGYALQGQKSEVLVHNQNMVSAINQSQEQLLPSGQRSSSVVNISASPRHPTNSNNVTESSKNVIVHELASTTKSSNPIVPGHAKEPTLLDERSLLACIVRAIPPGADGRTRISTSLPNRLAKMLAPLRWHDYKKHYGKLDDFVAHHPELFVIEGDFIHLREGAQEIISATTAFAKVAAAAASSAPYSSSLSSIALTPVAQNNRQLNGVSPNIVGGISDMKISIKSKTQQEVNGVPPEVRHAHSYTHNAIGNGASKGLSNGGFSSGREQTRSAGTGIISRR